MSSRRILSITGTALLALIVLPFLVYAAPQLVGANHGYVVLSDSMEPTIAAGDVVIVNEVPTANIDEGEIITFQRPGSETTKVTHRVIDVIHRDGNVYFRTKGDANEEPDAKLVPAENVIGVVVFNIPMIGYVISFGSSDLGVITLVLVPAVLLILNELGTLYRALVSGRETPDDQGESDDTPRPNTD